MGVKATIVWLIALVLASVRYAEAQQPKQTFRIGILQSGSSASNASHIAALRDGLRERGLWKGKTSPSIIAIHKER
jgi:hypothetical protein